MGRTVAVLAGATNRLEHLDRAGGVGEMRGHRVGDRAGHRRTGGEVHDGVGAVEHLIERARVEDRALDQLAGTPPRLARSPVDRSSSTTTSSPRSAR